MPGGPGSQHVGRPLTREVDAAGIEAGHREQIEFQGGDHCKVALAAAQRPEQVGFGFRVDVAQFAVRGDYVERTHVVGGVPVGAA